MNSGVRYLAGCLENNATPNLNRVVCEAFIKPAQQRVKRMLKALSARFPRT